LAGEIGGNGAFLDSRNLWNFSLSSYSWRPQIAQAMQYNQKRSNDGLSIVSAFSTY